jgi:hypothetical protein
LGRLDYAVAEATRSAEIWTEVARLRHYFESIQVAKAFRVFINCQMELGQKDAAILSLGRVFELLNKPLIHNPKPFGQVMWEMVEKMMAIDADAVARAVPGELLAILRDGNWPTP